jgi:hypothetical protein
MSRPVRLAALLSLLIPAAVLAQGTTSSPPAGGQPGSEDPMAGWAPRKVTPAQEKQGAQQIHQLYKKLEQAGEKGDLDAAVALVDFPVLMLTDNKAGEAVGAPWNEEQWKNVMTPFYKNPPKGMRTTHSPKLFFVSDTLASVDDTWTMTMGKKKTSGRSSMLVIRKGGEWKIKAMIESGWGDMGGDAAAGAPKPEGEAGGAK